MMLPIIIFHCAISVFRVLWSVRYSSHLNRSLSSVLALSSTWFVSNRTPFEFFFPNSSLLTVNKLSNLSCWIAHELPWASLLLIISNPPKSYEYFCKTLYTLDAITLSPMSTLVKLSVWRWALEARIDGAIVSISSFSRYWPTNGHTCCSTWTGNWAHGRNVIYMWKSAIHILRLLSLLWYVSFGVWLSNNKTICKMLQWPQAIIEEWRRQLTSVEPSQLLTH